MATHADHHPDADGDPYEARILAVHDALRRIVKMWWTVGDVRNPSPNSSISQLSDPDDGAGGLLSSRVRAWGHRCRNRPLSREVSKRPELALCERLGPDLYWIPLRDDHGYPNVPAFNDVMEKAVGTRIRGGRTCCWARDRLAVS